MRLITSMFLLSLLSVFQLIFSFPPLHPAECHSNERSALLQFKGSFVIDCRYASPLPLAYPKVASWKVEGNGSDCCSWDGVECDEGTGHVIGLNLTASCLVGSINSSSSLFHLVNLRRLSLAFNDFIGSQIPSAFGNLSELTHLILSNSLFFGQIPSEITKLSKLSYLDLSSSFNYNPQSERLLKLESPDLRSLVQNLTNLEYLVLSSVDIFSPVPDILANFSSLRGFNFVNSGLQGKFPAAIFQLPNLRFLEVAFNPNLTGHLPEFLWGEQLQALWLSNTSFSGKLPASIGNFRSLESIRIDSCNFSGVIPFSIGNLTLLVELGLQFNSFSGQIPSSIFNLSHLQAVYFDANNLSGTVDLDMFFTLSKLAELGLALNNFVVLSKTRTNATLSNLVSLGLHSCSLNDFPHFLQKQTKLHYLDLSLNNLQGKVPSWIWAMSTETLEVLDLSYNSLTSLDQPPAVLPWSHLSVLDFSSNFLTGALPIPPFSTIFYTISNNSLAGEIPNLICKISSLKALDLSKNKFNGTIPECLGNFSSSLSILNLKSNNLSGAIPKIWARGSSLRMISLGQNKLQGQIPTSITRCKKLEVLDLGNNKLTGAFPSWTGTLTELKILILGVNRFHGKIGTPSSIFSFPKLQILDLSSNNFTGNLPAEYFQCWHSMQVVDEDELKYLNVETSLFIGGAWNPHYYNISMEITNKGNKMVYERILENFVLLDFSCNKFEGQIPEFIGNLKGLRLLNLSNNVLSGFIPSSIGNIPQLETLDLSQNKLSGKIPQQLVQLNFLEAFNVSHNHLTGPIPHGKQFDTFPSNSFDGNSGLCGLSLSKKCENLKALPAPVPATPVGTSDESLELDWKFVVIGYGSGFVLGAVLGHIVTKRKRDWFLKTFRIRQGRRQTHRRRHGN